VDPVQDQDVLPDSEDSVVAARTLHEVRKGYDGERIPYDFLNAAIGHPTVRGFRLLIRSVGQWLCKIPAAVRGICCDPPDESDARGRVIHEVVRNAA